MKTPLRDERADGGSHWTGRAEVFGPAAAQGSKRIGRAGKNGKPILLDTDPRLRSWRGQMQDEMRKTAPPEPIDGPVSVRLIVYVPRPRAHYGTGRNARALKGTAPLLPMSGKDLDKIQRAVGDAGTGIWWRDDCRIVHWDVWRMYDPSERVIVAAETPGEWVQP